MGPRNGATDVNNNNMDEGLVRETSLGAELTKPRGCIGSWEAGMAACGTKKAEAREERFPLTSRSSPCAA